jgi:hypothetical protein
MPIDLRLTASRLTGALLIFYCCFRWDVGLQFYFVSERKANLMKSFAGLVVATCAVLAVSAAWAGNSAPRHNHHGRATHAAPGRPKPSAPAAQSGNS